ncbi:MAG: hypothetical protein ABIY70_20295 [Capsulimonas sp.]|uniref:hypothetical protein n=1 Tax=Capsulimonas sp. TaxID=2494211 RepID=UPI0032638C7F
MAKELTAAQLQQRQERLDRQSAPVQKSGSAEDVNEAEPVSLSVAMGEGETIMLGDRPLKIAQFPLKYLNEGYAMVYKCHALLLAIAMAAPDDAPADLELVTDVYNALLKRTPESDPPSYTLQEVTFFISALPSAVSNDTAVQDAMYNAVLFALRRRQKDITREELEEEFDLAWFLRAVRMILRVNRGMRESF